MKSAGRSLRIIRFSGRTGRADLDTAGEYPRAENHPPAGNYPQADIIRRPAVIRRPESARPGFPGRAARPPPGSKAGM